MATVNTVTFASALSTPAFTSIVVGPAEVLDNLTGIPDGKTPVTFRITGVALRAKQLELAVHQAKRISGGQPRRNLSGYMDAVADPGAQLVKVTWQEGTERAVTGIFTIPEATIGSGGHRVQSFSVIVYPCDRLRFYGQAISTAQTRTGL